MLSNYYLSLTSPSSLFITSKQFKLKLICIDNDKDTFKKSPIINFNNKIKQLAYKDLDYLAEISKNYKFY
jgi:hypothetical protein